MTIWELRFSDGAGTSVYTFVDPEAHIGTDRVWSFPVAATVFQGSALRDARRCFERDEVNELVTDMRHVAFVIRHET
jgi:hypothetical protein